MMYSAEAFSGTPEQIQGLTAQLDAVYYDLPETAVVGSMGRQLTLADCNVPDLPALPLINKNGRRDIDLLSVSEHAPLYGDPQLPNGPHRLDAGLSLTVKRQANGWWLVMGEEIAVQVDDAVFEPVVRHLGDVTVRTLSAPTHAWLLRWAIGRPNNASSKNNRSLRYYESYLGRAATVREHDKPLPDKFYQPFRDSAQALFRAHALPMLGRRAGAALGDWHSRLMRQPLI